MCRRIVWTSWIGIAWSIAIAAAELPRGVTIEDYFSLATVTQLAVSPDGQHVAYGEARWQQATDDRKTDLWIVPTGGDSPPRRLTFDRANCRSLQWSADSQTIYFLAERKREAERKPPYDGKTQVWRIAISGGEPQAVTQVEGGVTGYGLAPATGQLVYSIDTSVTDEDEFSPLRGRLSTLRYHTGKRAVSELWRLDLGTWRADKVLAEKRYIREFAVTADGRRIALISAADDTVLKSEGESRVDVWDEGRLTTPPTDAYRARASSPHAWLESLAWSADGRRFAFCAIFDAHPAEIAIGEKGQDSWRIDLMPRPADTQIHGYGSPLKWHPAEAALLFLADRAGRTVLLPSDPAAVRSLPAPELADHVVYAFDADAAGRLGVVLLGQPDRFPELYAAELKAGAPLRRLTTLNPQTAAWKLPTVRHITWKADDGTTVGGVLELPAETKPGTRLPLVVGLHGGPTTSVKAALEYDPYLGRVWLPAQGYAVLCPNYRGSTGYGDKFVTDLIGRENDLDVADIVAGVQHLVREGIGDPDAVGVLGWSNGGYLTNCLITRKTLPFKLRAASSGAGILDTVMEWGINDEPAYPKVFKTGLPWERPDVYRQTSPTYGLGNVATPTLIHVGENDVRCPPGHSQMLYRALHEYVGVPTELLVYPGEPHGLGRYSSRKAKMEWDAAWFRKYLGGPAENVQR